MPTRKRAKTKVKGHLLSEKQQKATENSMAEQQVVTERLLQMLLDERQRRDELEERRERQFNEQMMEMREWMERSQARENERQ